MPTHRCKYCEYLTDRKSNIDRHYKRVHIDELLRNIYSSSTVQNVNHTVQNVNHTVQNVNHTVQNVNHTVQNVNIGVECSECHKIFQYKSRLERHKSTCKGNISKNECCFCHKIYTHRQSLSRHYKTCNASLVIDTLPESTTIHEGDSQKLKLPNIRSSSQRVNSIKNATTIQNAQTIQNTTINVLNFPWSMEDDNFDFNTDHITKKHLRRITHNIRPEVSFLKFAMLTLEHPENRMVQKMGPNVNYSMVHVGNGIWELWVDEIIYPTIIHFLTCGALKIIEDNTDLRLLIEPFRRFVDQINTDNESPPYKTAETGVKLLIINLTRRDKLLTTPPIAES